MTTVNITIASTKDHLRSINYDRNDIIDERIERILLRLEETMRNAGSSDEEIRSAIVDKLIELQREYD